MDLLSFVRSLPKGYAYTPVYGMGVQLPGGKPAKGKEPLGSAHHHDYDPETVALRIEREPDKFKAVGIWTGARSNGLVIFDVDWNLGAVKKKWGADLKKAPRVESTKKNAAKYLFKVPKELWLEVKDISHAGTNLEGWEVLWGRHGAIGGAYKDKGEYRLIGDLNDVPEAPGWLLARMKESYQQYVNKNAPKKLKDTRWGSRSMEERLVIASSCLSVIEPGGRGTEDLWWRIGAMLHSELPNEEGLNLWREWSLKDDEYSDDWKDGKDPCLDRWNAGFNCDGGLGFGSLVNLADKYDPERVRFHRDGCLSVVEEVLQNTLKYELNYLAPEELLKRAIELEETIEDPAILDHSKHLLAIKGGRRNSAEIDQLLDQHTSFKRTNGSKPVDLQKLDNSSFDYLIPGLLPKPWLLLVHADGGTGKSAMAMTLCKHIVQGRPFNVHGKTFPVPKGKVLWLNGDQSERITRRQFNLIGVETGVDFIPEWDMQWYRRFCKMQKEGKYDLIIIDSLDGCNDSNPYEENRREYARPLKRLARRNGWDFPAASILVIHHNNRNGDFRGTSAIRAAVDETWNMTRLSETELVKMGPLPANTRLITVEKSRDDREGQKMTFTLRKDYTYEINELRPQTVLRGDTPQGYMLDVLDQMSNDTSVAWCVADIENHEIVGGEGMNRAIRYALEKLESQKLIERCAPPANRVFKGRRPTFYRALSANAPLALSKRSFARGVCGDNDVITQTPSAGTDLICQTDCQKSDFVKRSATGTDQEGTFDKGGLLTNALSNENPCPGTDPGFDAASHVHRVDWDAEDAKWADTPEVQVLDHGEEKRKQAETFFASAQAPAEPVVIDVPVNPPTLERD